MPPVQSLDFPDYTGSDDVTSGTGTSGTGTGSGTAADGSELSSDDYSYLYYEEYYEELVPEHHRFLQLESSSTTPKSGKGLFINRVTQL